MTITLLTALVILESFIILLFIIGFLIRKTSKLRKTLDDLLASLSDSVFSKLVLEEIDKTNERIEEIKNEDDELELAETSDDEEQAKIDKQLKKTFTFRSAYLHCEINAYEASEGDPDLFWHYLSENIQLLIHEYTGTSSKEDNASPEKNEFLDEVILDLQSKLDNSIDSNITLQALLDSLLKDGSLSVDNVETIKKSQADFTDLSQTVSDLGNKIQNSLNIDIVKTTPRSPGSNGTDKVVYIEKKSNKVNTEVNKLKDIIYEQGSKINTLLKDLMSNSSISSDSDLTEQFEALERSQNETAMCIDVLEMENHRLMDELESLQNTPTSPTEEIVIDGVATEDMTSEQFVVKIQELEKVIEEQEEQYIKLQKEFDVVQTEFLAVYDKEKEKEKEGKN